jgi:hypothetical protein
MTAQFATAMMNNSYCSTAAAASSSMRIRPLMDTAVVLVVSICVLCLLPLRILA